MLESQAGSTEQEATEIASSFHEYADFEYLGLKRAIFKVVPPQSVQAFASLLGEELSRYGLKAVAVRFQHPPEPKPGHIVASFISDLKDSWPPGARDRLERLAGSIGQQPMSSSEIGELLDECVRLTEDAVQEEPTIVLFLWQDVPSTFEALKLVNHLEYLTRVTHFLWCVISSSPHLMLFLGEIEPVPRKDTIAREPLEEFAIDAVTPPPFRLIGLGRRRLYNIADRRWVSLREITTIGRSADCTLPLTAVDVPATLAVYRDLVFGFSTWLEFEMVDLGASDQPLASYWPELRSLSMFTGRPIEQRRVLGLTIRQVPQELPALCYAHAPSDASVLITVVGTLGVQNMVLTCPQEAKL